MLTSIALGLAVGAVMALTGAGGGILAVPLLVFGLHLDVAQASPISLLAVGMSSGLGAWLGLREGIVRYRAAMLVSAVGVVFSSLGLWVAARVDNHWLVALFALVLAYIAWRGLRRHKPQDSDEVCPAPPCVCDAASGRFIWTARCARTLASIGSLTGFLSGLLGVGGGFVMVPALRRYTSLQMDSIVATSLAVIALVSAGGVASSLVAGKLDWAVAAPFCVGALAGMAGGRALSGRLGNLFIQRAFATVAACVSAGMLFKTFATLHF
jgi:uncharacterized membrane protein YfcA